MAQNNNYDPLAESFKDIERIFRNRDNNVNQQTYAHARNVFDEYYDDAVNATREERKAVKKNVSSSVIGKKFISFLLIVLLGFGIIKMGIAAHDALNSPTRMDNLSQKIGSIVYVMPEGYSSIYDDNEVSILSQNTARNANGPFYQHDRIAADLAKLPPELFDYALGALCYDMGPNIYNEVAHGGRTNIDGVIDILRYKVADPENDNERYIAERLNGVESLDDYLTKYGYVDKKGRPDLDLFIKACNNNAEQVLADLEAYISKGAGLK